MAKRMRRGMVASRVRGKVSGLERIWGTRPLIQISDGVMTLKTFAVLIVIFFLIVIMITMPYTEYLRKVVALMLQKKGELLLR